MPTPNTTWKCDKCGAIYQNEDLAKHCEVTHYEIVKIINVEYTHGKKAPQRIQVELDTGKDIYFDVVKDSWGAQ